MEKPFTYRGSLPEVVSEYILEKEKRIFQGLGVGPGGLRAPHM